MSTTTTRLEITSANIITVWGWGVVRDQKLFVISWNGLTAGFAQSTLSSRAIRKTQAEIDDLLLLSVAKALVEEIDATFDRIDAKPDLSSEEQAKLFGIEFDTRAALGPKPGRFNTVARTYALGTYAP